jgi:hypothetical protein
VNTVSRTKDKTIFNMIVVSTVALVLIALMISNYAAVAYGVPPGLSVDKNALARDINSINSVGCGLFPASRPIALGLGFHHDFHDLHKVGTLQYWILDGSSSKTNSGKVQCGTLTYKWTIINHSPGSEWLKGKILPGTERLPSVTFVVQPDTVYNTQWSVQLQVTNSFGLTAYAKDDLCYCNNIK